MGKFAENLNLSKRVLPPCLWWWDKHLIFDVSLKEPHLLMSGDGDYMYWQCPN